mmetsp:Transcript_34028/g.41973  ORF Transcript_34028/g.41973 Transcript_34028/m.41973 type:complete len:287 (-) Transcript_34028:341-1201(-)
MAGKEASEAICSPLAWHSACKRVRAFHSHGEDVASAVGVRVSSAGAVGPGPAAVVNAGAADLAANIVGGVGARVTEGEILGVVGADGLGLAGAGHDLEVADGLHGVTVARAGAAVLSEPAVIALPVGDDEGHAVGDVGGHVGHVAAVSASHSLGLAILGEHGLNAVEVVAAILAEGDLDVEWLSRVNGVLRARTISVPGELFSDVLANAISVAIGVEALIVRSIALVRGGGKTVLVSLHEVHLGAPGSVAIVGVAVEHAVGVPEGAILVLGGHGNRVESAEAAALV